MRKKDHKSLARCAECRLANPQRVCMTPDGKSSKNCPTLTEKKILAEANKAYETAETLNFAHKASLQEADCYANRDQQPYIMQPTKTRMVEICEFAEKMGYSRLGLAFCIGLAKEAGTVESILKERGFEVVSVLCKAGRTPKETIGISDKDKIHRGTDEAMCNPIFQAKLFEPFQHRVQHRFGVVRRARCTVFSTRPGPNDGAGGQRPRDEPQPLGGNLPG